MNGTRLNAEHSACDADGGTGSNNDVFDYGVIFENSGLAYWHKDEPVGGQRTGLKAEPSAWEFGAQTPREKGYAILLSSKALPALCATARALKRWIKH